MRAPRVLVQRDVGRNRIARVHVADRWTDAEEPPRIRRAQPLALVMGR